MARIKLSPEQVRQVSTQFKQASSTSDQLVRSLQQTVDGLAPDFEGMTRERFYSDFQTWKTSMTQFVELLNSIGQQLDAIATRFETADQG